MDGQLSPTGAWHSRSTRSGRAAFVSMVKTADFSDRDDVALAEGHDWTGNWHVLLQRQVRPRSFVVQTVTRHQRSHARLAERDHVIETLAPRRAHKSLDKRILPRRVRRREHVLDAHRFHGGAESVERVVAIMDQIPRGLVRRKRFSQLLGGLRGRGMRGDRHVPDAAPIVGQQHKNEHQAERHGRHDEEICRDDLPDVIGQERAPRL